MVRLEAAQASVSSFVKSQPLVAVFVGGTSGIGEYTLRALARTHAKDGKGLRVHLVGRSAEAADKILMDVRTVCPSGQFHFIQVADLTLLKDVDKCCEQIMNMEKENPLNDGPARIDVLCMSQGFVRFGPGKVTTEGIEVSMSLLYYSRLRFVMKLLPLLLAAPLPAHVISIYAAGMEKHGKLFSDDLSLTQDLKSHYSFSNCRTHAVYMKTMCFERLAQEHPGRLSLVHVYPGLAVGPNFGHPSLPLWFKAIWFLVGPLLTRFASIGHDEIGDRMLFLATPRYPARATSKDGTEDGVAVSTDGVRGGGAYSCNWDGETKDVRKTYEALRETDFADRVWQHTTKVFADIKAGGSFKA